MFVLLYTTSLRQCFTVCVHCVWMLVCMYVLRDVYMCNNGAGIRSTCVVICNLSNDDCKLVNRHIYQLIK